MTDGLFREQNALKNSIIIDLLFLATFTVYWFRWWNNRIVVATVVTEKNSNYACHCRIVGRIPTICLRLDKRVITNENPQESYSGPFCTTNIQPMFRAE